MYSLKFYGDFCNTTLNFLKISNHYKLTLKFVFRVLLSFFLFVFFLLYSASFPLTGEGRGGLGDRDEFITKKYRDEVTEELVTRLDAWGYKLC